MLMEHWEADMKSFIRQWGEAEVYNQKHVEKEPYDCQLECIL